MKTVDLSELARRRYARQILLPEVGVEGQRRLASARVLVVGAGGLGSPALQYLAAAGVGHLTVIDDDRVDESNLHRQLLYTPADVGRHKLEVVGERLRALAPELELDLQPTRLSADNARELVRGHDLVLDGTDNFVARYAINDACVLENVANVHGAVLRFEGQVSVFARADGPCYRCLFPDPPQAGSVPSCAEAGVLGVLPSVIGSLQATEALKVLLGVGEPLVGRMITYDALRSRFGEVRLRRDPQCALCGTSPTIRDVVAVEESCSVRDDPTESYTITVEELHERMIKGQAPTVLDVRLPEEIALAALPGECVHIPLHLLPMRFEELDPAREIAVLCHLGARSQNAVQFLLGRGFERPRNILGGIERWSQVIDSDVPRY